VTRGDGENVGTDTKEAESRLRETIRKHRGSNNPLDTVEVHYLDSCSLLGIVRQRRQKTRGLKWASQPIPIDNGYVGIVRLADYVEFLRNESGVLDELIFESNVRGNQGKTSVNRQMRAALDAGGTPDFWQLNNGVTVTCAKIQPVDAYNLRIEDAQVVNGLQTSRQIFGHFVDSKERPDTDGRKVIVKLIPVSDDAIRDKIITATNNQNPIKSSTLVLTKPVHRDIEDTFKAAGFFYDRRPGFYKDQGVQIEKIISLNEVTQAAISILLHRPDDARGRPGDYIRGEAKKVKKKGIEKHKLLFKPRSASKAMELRVYLKCVLLVRSVEDFLESVPEIDPGERRNVLFHISYHLACTVVGHSAPSVEDVFVVTSSQITPDRLRGSFDAVFKIYTELSAKADNPDIVAKGADMLTQIKAMLLPPPDLDGRVLSKPDRKIRDVLSALEFRW